LAIASPSPTPAPRVGPAGSIDGRAKRDRILSILRGFDPRRIESVERLPLRRPGRRGAGLGLLQHPLDLLGQLEETVRLPHDGAVNRAGRVGLRSGALPAWRHPSVA